MAQMKCSVALIGLLFVCHMAAALPRPQSLPSHSAISAMNLASSHTNSQGQLRPVGQIHGFLRPSGGGTLPNFNVGASAGAGTVLWRSPDRQHSIGVGATANQGFSGNSRGHSFQTPTFQGGLGYTFSF